MKKNRIVGILAALVIAVGGLLVQQSDVDAASLKTRILVQISGALTSTVGLSDASAPLSEVKIQDLDNGVGANQANVLYTANRALGSAATDSLDFAGGGLVDSFGAAIAPVRIRAVYILSATGNTTNLTLFGDANSVPLLNTAATTITLRPGGVFVYTSPDATGTLVTGGTGDIIKVVNAAGATANYKIIVLGANS